MHTYLSIGEFARATGLSVSAVRFYADRALLTPAHIDASSGYRSFSPAQVEAGCLIRDLRQIDLALTDIEDALAMNPLELAGFVERHVGRLQDRVSDARKVVENLALPTLVDQKESGGGDSAAPALVRGSDLCGAIDQVLPFVTRDSELPHLMTVRVEVKDGSVRLVATDTFRLALRDLVPVQVGSEFAVVVAAATLAKIRSELEPEGEVAMSADDANLTLTHQSGSTTARLVPATFPDYERFLTPRQQVSTVVVNKAELVQAFEALASCDTVQMSSSGEELILSGADLTVRLATQGASGNGVNTFVNPALSLDCATGAIGSEVAIEIHSSPLEPVVFRSATNGTYTSFLMPVRVDSTDQ